MLPFISTAKDLKKAKEILEVLFLQHYPEYHSLFVDCVPIKAPKDIDLSALIATNLLQQDQKGIHSIFRISKVFDLFIITDSPSYCGADRVWYLLEDESFLFARRVPILKGMASLDIGTGSGVLAIMAVVNGAREAIGIDVSERSIALATFNAALNAVKNVKFVKEGIESFHTASAFDYISFNPPFVPVPDNANYILSGAGGKDGLAIVHLFWQRLDELTHSRTMVDIISMSPGDGCVSALEKLFIKRFADTTSAVRSIDIYGETAPIDVAYSPFKAEKEFHQWKIWLTDQGYSRMHYHFIRVIPTDRFSFIKENLVPRLESTAESGTWKAMYAVIQNSKQHV